MLIHVAEKRVAHELFPDLSCPHCNTAGALEISVIRLDVTVGLLPMMARVKRTEIICQHCGLPVSDEEGGLPCTQACRALRSRTKVPLSRWFGTFFCLLVLGWVVASMVLNQYTNPMMQKIDLAMLAEPQRGDVYEVSIDRAPGGVAESEYTLVQVENIDGDAVTLLLRNNGLKEQFPPMYSQLVKRGGQYDGKSLVVRKKRLLDRDLCPVSGALCLGRIYATKRP